MCCGALQRSEVINWFVKCNFSQRFEEFKVLHERASSDLENLHLLLLDNKAARAEETEQALRTCARLNGDVKLSLDATLTNGE